MTDRIYHDSKQNLMDAVIDFQRQINFEPFVMSDRLGKNWLITLDF